MNLVLSGPIDDGLLHAVADRTSARRIVRLPSGACRLEDVETDDTADVIAEWCRSARVDHAFIESGIDLSRFKVIAMDMDSTLITIECIDEVAAFAGKKQEVAAITEAAMRGEIADFAESLRRRVALLAGTDAGVLRRVFDERLRLSPGAEQLLAEAKAHGIRTLLVSGGFTYFTDRLAAWLHFDRSFANRLEIVDGRLTGRVREPIFDSDAKAEAVLQTCRELACDAETSMVIGDGSNDLKMFSKTNTAIAYHAKPVVRQATPIRIDFGGLDTILDYFPATTPAIRPDSAVIR